MNDKNQKPENYKGVDYIYIVVDNSTGKLRSSSTKSLFLNEGHIKRSNLWEVVKKGEASVYKCPLETFIKLY